MLLHELVHLCAELGHVVIRVVGRVELRVVHRRIHVFTSTDLLALVTVALFRVAEIAIILDGWRAESGLSRRKLHSDQVMCTPSWVI